MLLQDHFEDMSQVKLTKFIVLNSTTFAKGLFIIYSNELHQIEGILKHTNTIIFLCTKYTTVKFFTFANCIEIQKTNEMSLITLDTLACKRSYEAKYLNNKPQIIADDVDMVPIYEKFVV